MHVCVGVCIHVDTVLFLLQLKFITNTNNDSTKFGTIKIFNFTNAIQIYLLLPGAVSLLLYT